MQHKRFVKTMFLAAALSAALCACKETAKTEKGKTEPQPGAAGEITMLEPGTRKGRYCIAEGQSSEVICWMDYNAVQETPLCSAPNCEHNSEACTAFLPEGYTNKVLALGEDQLLFVLRSNTHKWPTRLMVADRDGGRRHQIAQVENGDDILTPPFCADDRYVYFEVMHKGGESHPLARAPLDGGEVEFVMTPKSDTWRVVNAAGRKLMLLEQDWEKLEFHLYTYDVDSGKTQQLDASFLDVNKPCDFSVSAQGKVYFCDQSSVHWVDMEGQSGQIPIPWPEGIDLTQKECRIETLIGSKLLFSVGWHGSDDAVLARMYALDLDSAQLQEAPLQYINSKSVSLPLDILGQSEDSLLVRFACDTQQYQFMLPNGVPTQGLRDVCRYGMISLEDYLAGKVNYREFPMSFQAYSIN